MKRKYAEAAERLRGPSGFEERYASLFSGRWPLLRKALCAEGIYSSLDFGGSESYYLDPASVCAALCLPVKGRRRLLDLCAAPGGKTLVLAGNMDDDAVLYSNERSPSRKLRLSEVVGRVLPAETAGRIVLSCSDGATWCRRGQDCYDAVLLDAPCSSERHLLADEKYLKEWSPARIRSLAMEQWALLSCAWRLLAPGAYVLYATCALSPEENGGLVERLQKKFPAARLADKVELALHFEENLASFTGTIGAQDGPSLREVFASAESVGGGLHILPDASQGAGPLFFALLQKPAG